MSQPHPLVTAIESGLPADHANLAALPDAERSQVFLALMATQAGRRWLRQDPALNASRAGLLLEHEPDFRQPRRDRSLALVVERAPLNALERHVNALAAGPAAAALWRRLAVNPECLAAHAARLVTGSDTRAAEATLHLLVLDHLDPYQLGDTPRGQIAAAALGSRDAGIRGLASEFLATHDPAALERALEQLLADESQRVRGIAWDAALRVARPSTVDRASVLLTDESAPVPVRRSALMALGTVLPTAQMADLLSYFVVHPNHELASDAASLLYQQHRNPLTATAARDSPHADVRELAERLLDPQRGSPAAGGSRPGDPTRASADIYADLLRSLEHQTEDQNDRPGR